jgi:hypothetical protein
MSDIANIKMDVDDQLWWQGGPGVIQPNQTYVGIYWPAAGTQFPGALGWVCRIFVSEPLEGVAQVDNFLYQQTKYQL